MSEQEILKYLKGGRGDGGGPPKKVAIRRRPQRAATQDEESTFKNFSATHLFCPKCRQAMPVRERVLLYLSDGVLYDYNCQQCGTSTGTKKA